MSTAADQAPVTGASMSYVYAVGRSDAPLGAAAPGRNGLEGGALRTVEAAGMAALVSSVPQESFGTEGLRSQMEDMRSLERLARGHHSVVEAAYESATVLPMRLATVYLDDERVREMLRERGAEFDALLSELEGRVELGVKVYADPRQASAREAADSGTTEAEAAGSPGRAYLARRRAQRRQHGDVHRAAGAVAAEVPARVSDIATAAVRHRPQQGELAEGVGENISNEAYLVPAERVGDFRAALEGLAEESAGVRVEITGPWAPYSFATPAEPAQGGAGR